MNLEPVHTFLELGNSTSRNLEYSCLKDVQLNYGEETISETNLLEIRRRHEGRVYVRAFTRHEEGKNGADWEWHIIGTRRTLKMRVQAKRTQCDGSLVVAYKGKNSNVHQRELLMKGAREEEMKAIYCIYCTNSQRQIWDTRSPSRSFRGIQYGCLLAGADDVPEETQCLADIEEKCIPWHFLFLPQQYWSRTFQYREEYYGSAAQGDWPSLLMLRFVQLGVIGDAADHTDASGWNCPTIEDLNHITEREFDQTGVGKTGDEDRARVEPDTESGRAVHEADGHRLREQGVPLMVVMDVRDQA